MEKVIVHLNRLRRHYDTALNYYDEAALLDLSNILRIWTEMKNPLKEISPKFSAQKIFKTSMPGRKIIKLSHNLEYVFAYMPTPVVTCANNGKSLSVPVDKSKEFSASIIMNQKDDRLEIRNFSAIGKSFRGSITAERNQEIIKSHTFINWLGAEAVRCAYLDDNDEYKEYAISREMLIKRVANTLHGSHYSTMEDNSTLNKFDAPIHHLLKFKVGGLPLPYFILMKTAQDIIYNSNKITKD